MRYSPSYFNRLLRSHLLLFVSLSLASLSAVAQESSPALPGDPKALLLQALKSNGLFGPDMQSWHLKASWKLFDEQGSVKDKGTYEEMWAGPSRQKRILTGSNFSETSFRTEHGLLRSGVTGSVPWQVSSLGNFLAAPLPREGRIATLDVEFLKPESDGDNSKCVVTKDPSMASATGADSGTYCFDPLTSVLRSATTVLNSAGDTKKIKALYKNRVTREGRSIPGDLELWLNGQFVFTAHLESFEALSQVDDALFTPPPDATQQIQIVGVKGSGQIQTPSMQPLSLQSGRFSISGTIAQSLLVQKTPVVYPHAAAAARLQGTVVLQARIAKDGTVAELKVISGHPMLQQAALDAVKQWVYRPYLLNGNPVEVLTTVNVIFTLGGPPQSPSPNP